MSSTHRLALQDDPERLRRLALWLYAAIGPLFTVMVVAEARPDVRLAAAAVVAGLILFGATLLLLVRPPASPVWMLSGAIVPIVACGVAYAASGEYGAAYLAIMAAPVAWTSVLFGRPVVVVSVATAIVTHTLVIPAPGGLGDLVLNTAIFATVTGLVALVGYARSEALRRSRAEATAAATRTAALLDAIPDTVGRIATDGTFLDVRAPAGSSLALAPEAYIGHCAYDFLPPSAQAPVREAVMRAAETGELQHVTYDVPSPGGVTTIETRIVRSAPGELVVIRQDVTDRVRSERTHAMLAALVERMDESMVVVDPAGIVQLWTAGAERVYGWSADEVMGRSLGPLIVPDGTEAGFAEFCRANLAIGQSRQVLERVRKDGRRIAVEASFTALTDGSGAPTAILTITRDVTATREAHDHEVRDARLRGLDERMNEIEIVAGLDGRIDHANDRAVAAYGYDRDELLTMRISDLRAPDAPAPSHEELGQASSPSVRFSSVHRRRDGSTFPVEVSSRSFEVAGIPHIHSLVLDVTERRRMEAEQQDLLEELLAALSKVRTLSGLLPICMYCKKIRNDQGYWDRIEKYVSEHTDAQFTHGMCPDCFGRYVEPELEGAERGRE